METKELIESIEGDIKKGIHVGLDRAKEVMDYAGNHPFELFAVANRIREYFKKNIVRLCSIINAKSGACDQDCSFCSQSSHNNSDINAYPLLNGAEIMEGARNADGLGVEKYGIVTSGKSLKKKEMDGICTAVSQIKEKTGIHRCASLGTLSYEGAIALKNAGLQEYHHNLETSADYYKVICTTRDYDDNVNTVKNAKRAGLRVCSGGLFGLGERRIDRLKLFFELKELDVDTVPINFLNPIQGTKLENNQLLMPMEALIIIAMARIILPDKDIKVAGGREKILRDLQPLIFFAGANSIMVGGYLTTKGRSYKEDIQMIKDLGLRTLNQ